MTEIFEPTSAHDPRLARGADGLLAAFNEGGLLDAADVRVAQRVGTLGGESDEAVLLAVALAVWAVRHGSVAVALGSVRSLAPDLPWPDQTAWEASIAASPLVAGGVLHQDLGLVYLDRYHRLECQVADDLAARAALAAPAVDEDVLTATLERVRGEKFNARQEVAVDHAARHRTTVITGGPGTGKTTTVARLLLALTDQFRSTGAEARRFSVALAAPTGKAATRLQEAVAGEVSTLHTAPDELPTFDSMTLHRLLGWRPDNTTRFVHHRGNRLKYDLIVVDEASMIDLTMMARLLEAVRPETRLVLVGDPEQLTSVGAGAVLKDLVEGFRGQADSPVVELTENHRSTDDIKDLAAALRVGDVDGVLAVLRTPSDEVEFVETDDPADALRDDCTAAALEIRTAAAADGAPAARAITAIAALDRHRLLCAHREGPYGVRHWNRQVEQWLTDALGTALGSPASSWYAGRPLLVTTNDYALDIYNGETGVVIADATGRARAWIAGAGAPRSFAPGRLDAIETMHALTIHKSQGSQAERVTVLLPDADSRLLSRELFYTAVTRAQQKVRIVGTEAAVRAAVGTTAQRATGLARRLAGG